MLQLPQYIKWPQSLLHEDAVLSLDGSLVLMLQQDLFKACFQLFPPMEWVVPTDQKWLSRKPHHSFCTFGSHGPRTLFSTAFTLSHGLKRTFPGNLPLQVSLALPGDLSLWAAPGTVLQLTERPSGDLLVSSHWVKLSGWEWAQVQVHHLWVEKGGGVGVTFLLLVLAWDPSAALTHSRVLFPSCCWDF